MSIRKPLQLSDAERNLVWEALTMMIQEINQAANQVHEANKLATLGAQPLKHAPDVQERLLAISARAYQLRKRLEDAID